MNPPKKSTQFLSIIQQNKGIIYKVANFYCRNAEDRKDLIQEIIVQLWLALEKYDQNFAISTWIYRIALNVSISFYRKETRRNNISQPIHDELIYLEDETYNEMEDDLGHLQRFIRELREIDRAIILLHLEGNSQQEMADILGLSLKNVSVKLFRIKQELKQKFATRKS